MPLNIEEAERYEAVVLWNFIGRGEDGEPVVDAPIEIRCRWENIRKEMKDEKGNVVIVDAVVVVEREIKEGSQMWLGELDSWMGTGSSGDDTQVMEVIARGNIPDIKNRFRRRVVGLSRFRDSPNTE